MRLQKYLAKAGIASRRQSEKLIDQGRVRVNGQLIKEQGLQVDPEKDQVRFDGQLVTVTEDLVYYMLNKPVGYVSTALDEKGRKTVLDLLPSSHRIYPVGRLDMDTRGLLLVTNDGDLTYKITHPKHELDKVYHVAVTGPLAREKKMDLEAGCHIGPYAISGARISPLAKWQGYCRYEIIIHEGKNRQVRQMMTYAGLQVKDLQRVAIGNLSLGDLKETDYRELSQEEIQYLKTC